MDELPMFRPAAEDELPVFWTEAETGDQVDYVPLPLDPENPYRAPRYREIRRARAKIGEYTDPKDLPEISRRLDREAPG